MSDIKKYSGVPVDDGPMQPSNLRREERKRVLGAAKLLFGGFSKTVFDCIVLDRSPRGLRVQVGSTHMIPSELIVEFSNGTRRHARLVWASASEAGLEYETDSV
jgi:hypothetical protein